MIIFELHRWRYKPISLYHLLNGITNPKYKLLRFSTTNFFKSWH